MSTRPAGLINHLHRTTNGGASWQYLGDFYVGKWDFADADVGWAADTDQGFVRTNDGGSTWESVPTPDADSIDSEISKVISWDEAIVRTFKNSIATVHHTTDGGQTWVSAPPGAGGVRQYFLDGTYGWGVAFFNIYRTTDGGANWTSTPHLNQTVREIVPLDHDSAIAVGDWGYIIRTDDGGVTWSQLANGSGKDLVKVEMANASAGWAVGQSGAILHTTDGGSTWNIQIPPNTWHLGNLQVLSPLIAVVHKGTIGGGNLSGYLRTTDGGQTWIDISQQWPFGLFRFLDENRGAIISLGGSQFHWTEDGGQTWETRNATGINLNGIETLYDVYMIDENLGWTVGRYRKVFRTTDGGRTWTQWGSPNGPSQIYRHVRFADANTGWIAGNSGTIYYTNNGGQSWQDRSLWNFNQHIQDLHIVGTNEAYIVGGYSGARPGTGWLRRTTDTGQNWQFVFNNRRGIQNGVSVIGEHIWTAGYGGTIHHFGPDSQVAVFTDVDVVTGTLLAGGINELTFSDDAYLHTRSGFGLTLVDLHNMETIIAALTLVDSPAAIDLTIESRIDDPTGQ